MKRIFRDKRGFTLVELMTVLAILAILMSILVVTVSKIRRAAQTAAVKQQINEIDGAIQRFHQEQGSYPGPLINDWIYTSGKGRAAPIIYDASGATLLQNVDKITQSENLVLGLLGGLKFKVVGASNVLCFDPALVGGGMINMSGKKFPPYMSLDPRTISTGQYSDGAGAADDSPIPELLDRYPNPMPILYMRAHVGATGGVVRNDIPESADPVVRQYTLSDVYPYTHGSSGSIGEGKTVRAADYTSSPSPGVFPHGLQTVDQTTRRPFRRRRPDINIRYDLVPYLLMNPNILPTKRSADAPNDTAGTPRSKDYLHPYQCRRPRSRVWYGG